MGLSLPLFTVTNNRTFSWEWLLIKFIFQKKPLILQKVTNKVPRLHLQAALESKHSQETRFYSNEWSAAYNRVKTVVRLIFVSKTSQKAKNE